MKGPFVAIAPRGGAVVESVERVGPDGDGTEGRERGVLTKFGLAELALVGVKGDVQPVES